MTCRAQFQYTHKRLAQVMLTSKTNIHLVNIWKMLTLYLIDPSWMDKKCSQVAVTCIVRGLFVSEGEGIGVAATQDSTGSTVNLSLLFLC